MKRFIYLSMLLLISPTCMAGSAANPPPQKVAQPDEAHLGSAPAAELTRLGIAHEHGHGVKKNLTFAIKLLCKAARKEHALAQYELGWIYMNGRHGKRDLVLAAAWFHQAASQGDLHAARLLKFIGSRNNSTVAQCLLPDGSVFPQPTDYPEPENNTSGPDVQTIRTWVNQLAPKYNLQPRLVFEVIRAESNFDANARSPKNACGLMQLIPATAKRFGVTDIWDPIENLKGGMAYLQWLQDYFKGNLELTLAAYNAGEGAVIDNQGVPPYTETQRYVTSIIRKLDRVQREL